MQAILALLKPSQISLLENFSQLIIHEGKEQTSSDSDAIGETGEAHVIRDLKKMGSSEDRTDARLL